MRPTTVPQHWRSPPCPKGRKTTLLLPFLLSAKQDILPVEHPGTTRWALKAAGGISGCALQGTRLAAFGSVRGQWGQPCCPDPAGTCCLSEAKCERRGGACQCSLDPSVMWEGLGGQTQVSTGNFEFSMGNARLCGRDGGHVFPAALVMATWFSSHSGSVYSGAEVVTVGRAPAVVVLSRGKAGRDGPRWFPR